VYVERDFEFININTDDYQTRDSILSFLRKEESSGKNYIITENDKNKLIEAIAPTWDGKLPYTLMVEPGGKIVYSTQEAIDLEGMRKMIFNDPFIGRLYK
jgi:hypothetical protein